MIQFTGMATNHATRVTTNHLRAVVRGNSTWVAVGDSGTILTSHDAVNWRVRTSGTSNHLYGVAYSTAASIFVAVGQGGIILSSPDAVTWTSRTSNTTNTLRCVQRSNTVTNSAIVAVGDGGTIRTSTDGTTWTSRTSGTTENLNGVVRTKYGSQYIAVGNNGTIRRAGDPASWTGVASGTTANLRAIAWVDNSELTAMAVADNGLTLVMYEDASETWDAGTTSAPLYAAAAMGGAFLSVGQGGKTRFTDGWGYGGEDSISNVTVDLYGIAHSDISLSVYVAVGASGSIYTLGGSDPRWL